MNTDKNISERLPNRKEELKVTGALHHGGENVRSRIPGAGFEELLHRSLEPVEVRWVDAVREVQSNRTHGCAVADTESRRMDHVIEVLKVPLARTKRDFVDAAVHVS